MRGLNALSLAFAKLRRTDSPHLHPTLVPLPWPKSHALQTLSPANRRLLFCPRVEFIQPQSSCFSLFILFFPSLFSSHKTKLIPRYEYIVSFVVFHFPIHSLHSFIPSFLSFPPSFLLSVLATILEKEARTSRLEAEKISSFRTHAVKQWLA